jgi:hypothetical protein
MKNDAFIVRTGYEYATSTGIFLGDGLAHQLQPLESVFYFCPYKTNKIISSFLIH